MKTIMPLFRLFISLAIITAVFQLPPNDAVFVRNGITAALAQSGDSGTATVNAKDLWQSTGISVTKSKAILIKVASGTWTHWVGGAPNNPGTGGTYICTSYFSASQCVEPMPYVPQGALIGKIGNQAFKVGDAVVVIPKQTGTLYLQINDGQSVTDRADNAGTLTVTVAPQYTTADGAVLIRPVDNSKIGPSSITVEAEKKSTTVESIWFYVMYDRQWHDIGFATQAPYQVSWHTPDGLRSQQLHFRIDVHLTNGEVQMAAGGERTVSFTEAEGNPKVIENWIGPRFYLNQNFLSDSFAPGNVKCSAASMAMVLAGNFLIPGDSYSMATKANQMYKDVLNNNSNNDATVGNMVRVLKEAGAITPPGDDPSKPMTNDEAWQTLKREIDSDRPVIVRTEHGIMTKYGHFFVAVGYREEGTIREVIANDPFGKWKGLTCAELGTSNCLKNYYMNFPDHSSRVGKWVYYNFDLVYGDYLITAKRASNAPPLYEPNFSNNATTPPDTLSEEPEIVGDYEGVITIAGTPYKVYAPAIRK